MPTRIELLKHAGFSDAEIGDWATAERQRMNAQGFTDDEIDEEFGVTRPPKEVPEAFIERLKQGNAAQRIAGAAVENPAQSFTLPEMSLVERYKFSDAPDIIKRLNPGYHIIARGQAQGGRYSDMTPAEREDYQRRFVGAAGMGLGFVNPFLGAGISASGALASGDPEGAAGEAVSAAVPYGLARYPRLGLAALTGWLAGTPTEAEATPLSKLFRGVKPEGRAVYNDYIRRHFRKADDFAEKYFSGMHNDRMMMSGGPLSGQGPYLDFDGPLTRGGQKIGDISRTFYPDERLADHKILDLLKQHQGQGIAKRLLADQFDVYQKMNFGRVNLFAGLDSGPYTWAKFGFLPSTRKTWTDLANAIDEKLQGVQGLDPAVRRQVEGWLKSRDPRTLWKISDLDQPIGPAGTKLGKVLLLPQSWKGRFDLKNAEQMDRFNEYVGR